jgi:gamma-glutamylcyclotransferase
MLALLLLALRVRRQTDFGCVLRRGKRMAMFHYFAYGSNMLTERLRARCPSAVCVGIAEATNFALEFGKRSKDKSGKATLVATDGRNSYSLGVVFEINKTEQKALDKFEGFGKGYDADDSFPARLVGDGAIIHTRTYLADALVPHLRPYDWYLALIIAGAQAHGLDRDYVTRLRQVAFDVDPDKGRPTRTFAIAALERSGFPDYETLLSQNANVHV